MTKPETLPPKTSTARLVKGLNFLLSEQTGYRTHSLSPFGAPESQVLIKEADLLLPDELPVFGVKLVASFDYDSNGSIEEGYAHITDHNTNLWVELPLESVTGTIDAAKVAAWNEQTKQRAEVIVSRLMTVVFRAT